MNDDTKTLTTRVPIATVDQIDAMRGFFPKPDGKAASYSSILRAIIQDFLPLLDPEILNRVDAARQGRSRAETIRAALVVGLDALGKAIPKPAK